jgi:hypothetical protein
MYFMDNLAWQTSVVGAVSLLTGELEGLVIARQVDCVTLTYTVFTILVYHCGTSTGAPAP